VLTAAQSAQDGNRQRAAANASFAIALFRVTFDETASQGAEACFLTFFRNTSGLERHHTPPQIFCEPGPLWVPADRNDGNFAAPAS
jgi:hypothetical protein